MCGLLFHVHVEGADRLVLSAGPVCVWFTLCAPSIESAAFCLPLPSLSSIRVFSYLDPPLSRKRLLSHRPIGLRKLGRDFSGGARGGGRTAAAAAAGPVETAGAGLRGKHDSHALHPRSNGCRPAQASPGLQLVPPVQYLKVRQNGHGLFCANQRCCCPGCHLSLSRRDEFFIGCERRSIHTSASTCLLPLVSSLCSGLSRSPLSILLS